MYVLPRSDQAPLSSTGRRTRFLRRRFAQASAYDTHTRTTSTHALAHTEYAVNSLSDCALHSHRHAHATRLTHAPRCLHTSRTLMHAAHQQFMREMGVEWQDDRSALVCKVGCLCLCLFCIELYVCLFVLYLPIAILAFNFAALISKIAAFV